ncbi:MAG: ABC transporter substrate-binding protein [Candidatus Rokuibacteriota bacterium]
MTLIVTLALGLLAAPLAVEAQQPGGIPRIGVLSFPTGTSPAASPAASAFRQGLRELGYVEGQNIAIEYRWAGGKAERLAPLAAELVALKVDVIVTSSTPAIRAAKQATKSIPIVMAASGDAVGAGLVKSLPRSGENVTGLTFQDPEVSAKRLQLLKEAFPRVSRVAVLRHTTPEPGGSLRAMEGAARSLGLQLQIVTVDGPEDFDRAFGAMKQGRAQALAVMASPILFANRKPLIELAARHRLPAIYQWREIVEQGGLMSYSASLTDMFRRAATYVDKILKGAKPGDLPVEQPTKFELVVNLKGREGARLHHPAAVLARADQVIQ